MYSRSLDRIHVVYDLRSTISASGNERILTESDGKATGSHRKLRKSMENGSSIPAEIVWIFSDDFLAVFHRIEQQDSQNAPKNDQISSGNSGISPEKSSGSRSEYCFHDPLMSGVLLQEPIRTNGPGISVPISKCTKQNQNV
jgi:hypothetical protein